MTLLLLDTSICIELIRGRAPAVESRLRRRAAGSVGLSTVTLAELRCGVEKSSNPARNVLALARFCAPLRICVFDAEAAAAYGRVRAALERAGTPIGPLDTLIAAHAIALRAAVLTANVDEFRRVRGLRVADWKLRG